MQIADDVYLTVTNRVVETVGALGVAGRALLVDPQRHGVAIAIQACLDRVLAVPGGLALAPQAAVHSFAQRRVQGVHVVFEQTGKGTGRALGGEGVGV